jgi:hypothetical protein
LFFDFPSPSDLTTASRFRFSFPTGLSRDYVFHFQQALFSLSLHLSLGAVFATQPLKKQKPLKKLFEGFAF